LKYQAKSYIMKITVLVENSLSENKIPGLKPEHGLSIHIALEKTNILFDVGQSDLFAKNAKTLGIDLSLVDFLILSHGHFDHGGGLKTFFEINEKASVYMHKEAVKEHYAKIFGWIPYNVGLNKETIDKNKHRIHFIDQKTSISQNILLIDNFPTDFPQPSGNRSLYEKKGQQKAHDTFQHEIALLINEKDKSILFTACSHSGIINMHNKAKELNGGKKIDHVLGGFHTHNPISKRNESKAYLERLTGEMEKTHSIYHTGHCTGKSNLSFMKKIMKDKILSMNTGERIEI
jgi:7,8-dihydropterin-6-yl-methyl-4-(beta-D-ribofuranosyl)aminobenzene 5'-phosphate synthase